MKQIRLSSFALARGLIIGAVLSKVLGIVREIVQARTLGTSVVADSLRGALGVVLVPISPLYGDVIGSVLIPLYRDWQADGVARVYFSSLLAAFFCVVTLLAIPVWAFAGLATDVVVGGFNQEARSITIRFVHIMAFSMPAYVLATVISAAEIAGGRPRAAMLRASAQNIGALGGILTMYFTGITEAIAYGFMLSVNAIALYGLFLLWYHNEIAFGVVRFRHMRQAVVIFLNRMRGLYGQPLIEQAALLVERFVASFLVIGTLASLDYARTLTDTAMLLIGQPLGYVILARSATDSRDTSQQVVTFAGPLLGVGIPMSIFLVVFAPDIIHVVLARGAFDQYAVNLTAGALRGISAGLWAALLAWVLVRMLISSDRRVRAGRIIMAAFLTNIVVDAIVAPRLGSLGLGLGEGMRGVAMLVGAVVALKSANEVIRLMVRTIPFVVALSIAFILISNVFQQPLVRVALAGFALALTCLAWLALTSPDVVRRALGQWHTDERGG